MLGNGVDAYRGGDGLSAREVLGPNREDARDLDPDSAGSVGLLDGRPSEVGGPLDVPMLDARDTGSSVDAGGADDGPGPSFDVPIDAILSIDSDARGAGDDLKDAGTVDASALDQDAPMDGEDAGSVAVDAAGADSGPSIDPTLVLWYQFDESGDSIAYDSAQVEGSPRNATLATIGPGSRATFTTTRQVGTHALSLVPASAGADGGGYVSVPALNELAPGAVTIAVWVKLATATSSQTWERVYDFGDSATAPRWFNLAARGQTSPYGPIFNISSTGHAAADQQTLIGSTALVANTWHHVAVVLDEGATYTGIMYVDGVVAARNTAMTVHLSDIGPTTRNWLGRSQFPDDPYFDGSLDDFRVYRRALSPEEIVALMALR